MSQITFEFYGRLERLAHQSEISLKLNTPVSIENALQQLAELKPDLSENLERCACAIGDELVSRSMLVDANTRVALLPPVAGG
ncbi:MoaD/ThiS family protein [Alkanindiges illinoisensis]|uniref:MoaD/ThiS family protein n=1 Tax=Alkanindiges illinoisensis TaxID=197183 RepID=A0A4Y7XFX0_9GAMM|nr:MoaD/ThiS family protein [Alkanindiges illinoisensis]TEU30717.1 MoaD/ThiS family protein [Alkanindiges illinoisensis]